MPHYFHYCVLLITPPNVVKINCYFYTIIEWVEYKRDKSCIISAIFEPSIKFLILKFIE